MQLSSALHIRPLVGVSRSVPPLLVARAEQVAAQDWWQLCEADPDATFFATPTWAGMLSESYPLFRPYPFLFLFEGCAPILVPAMEVRRLGRFATSVHSMPFGTYGGVVGPRSLRAPETELALRLMTRGGIGRLQTTVHPNPLGAPLPRSVAIERSYVHTPDLAGGWDGWWSGLDQNGRYCINKARRRGVVIRDHLDEQTLDGFHLNYALWCHENGKPFPGDRFFQALWRARSRGVRLWTAYRRGELLAAVLGFEFQRQLVIFMSFGHRDARPHAPKNLIYSEIVRYACESGIEKVNYLGSGRFRTIEAFKESVGGSKHQFNYMNVHSALGRLAAGTLRSLTRSGTHFLQSASEGRRGIEHDLRGGPMR